MTLVKTVLFDNYLVSLNFYLSRSLKEKVYATESNIHQELMERACNTVSEIKGNQ